jgi:hypothetical protein
MTEGGEMTEYKQLTKEELEAIAGEELPERAAMSLINANVAAPINLAAALNVLSDNSVAYADATQVGDITQNTERSGRGGRSGRPSPPS